MASRGVRLACVSMPWFTHARATAVNQVMRSKLRQMQKISLKKKFNMNIYCN